METRLAAHPGNWLSFKDLTSGSSRPTTSQSTRSLFAVMVGSARVDCNRSSSTWRVAKGELQFGSWSRTNAKCGPGSLHDQIVTEGAMVRNFVFKDGHLFLSGMEGGGYYELEPVAKKQ